MCFLRKKNCNCFLPQGPLIDLSHNRFQKVRCQVQITRTKHLKEEAYASHTLFLATDRKQSRVEELEIH